jgi:hypothetical protein
MMRRRSIRLATRATLIALAVGLGFGAGVPAVLVSANAAAIPSFTDLPTVTLQFPPDFAISPTTLDFGDLDVGGFRSLAVILTNDGTQADYVYMTGGTPTSTGFQFLRDDNCLSKTYDHGKTCRLYYSFTPESIGHVQATSTFLIHYIGEAKPTSLTVKLSGCGVPANGTCPPPPTSTPTARPTTRGAGTRTGTGTQPTSVGTTTGATAIPPAAPVSTALAAQSVPTGGGPNLLVVALVALAAAFVGVALAGLLFWRGRQIWARLRSRRP